MKDAMKNTMENVKNDTLGRKKLLITASTFPRWKDDTEPRFILDYAKAMKAYYDVTVLVPAAVGAKEEEMLEQVHVVRYHYFPIHKYETLCYPGAILPRIKQKKIRIILVPCLMMALHFKIRKMIHEYDIVHAHWLIPQGIVQCGFKKSYMVTGHGGDVTSLNIPLIKGLKKKCLKKAKHITVVSKALEEYVQKFYANDKTSVLPMGCDTSRFSPTHRIENYFNQNDKKVILFVGRLAEKKGVTYLIEAMKQVDDAVLVIVGKGELEKSLMEQATEQGDKIRFIGPKTHDELPEVYASADVFVAPSITARDGDKEGFGLVIIEAMASGLPVISSNSGGIPDIITHESNGLLCGEKDVLGIANALNRVIKDEIFAAKLVDAGYETAMRYSYDNIAHEYHKILSTII